MSSIQEAVELVIVTYDDIYLSVVRLRDGWADAYQRESAILRLSAADAKKLGLNEGGRVELTSRSGSVVVVAKVDTGCSEGVGCMPASPYSNRLASYDPGVARLPDVKRIVTTAAATGKEVTPLPDILVRRTFA